ncbi:hypothetical protein HPB50_018923 [Hyalomma asiaticum]|uniref:Uncharacterized protein n=1 Tax=Hyalomma asiaticum TaxID=266040 RepID=A0ACB7TMV9_HYAAI|nr:hypothetical protein HPB50_018923 [Hyalomma asiaticum]
MLLSEPRAPVGMLWAPEDGLNIEASIVPENATLSDYVNADADVVVHKELSNAEILESVRAATNSSGDEVVLGVATMPRPVTASQVMDSLDIIRSFLAAHDNNVAMHLLTECRVLAARATSLDLSRPWKAGLPLWLSLLGTSLCDASSGASHPPQFLSDPNMPGRRVSAALTVTLSASLPYEGIATINTTARLWIHEYSYKQAAAQEPQQDVVHPVDETVTCAMMTDEIVTVTAIAVGILTKIEDLMTVTRTVHLIGAQIETKKGCKSVIEC